MNAQPTEDPQTILDRIQSQATRFETPCGDGKMIWHLWDQSGGTAPVVVLFHGGAGSWRHWVRTIPALVPTCRVLVPDLPGLGESDMPPVIDDAFAIAAIVADGIDAMVGAATSYDVVGFSFGGTVAACVGALRGKRVRSVTIIGSSGVSATGVLGQSREGPSSAGAGAPRDPSHQSQPPDDRRSGEDRRPRADDPGLEHRPLPPAHARRSPAVAPSCARSTGYSRR